MEPTDIPVLTTVYKGQLAGIDMPALVAQLKQAMLPELEALVSHQLTQQTEVVQQQFSTQAQAMQQSVLQEARQQLGGSIEAIEDAFRQAMSTLGQQQVQALEHSFAQLVQAQQTSMTQQMQQWQDEAVATITTYTRLLQEESRQKIATEQAQIEADIYQRQRMALETALSQFAAMQTAAFKDQFTADAQSAEAALQTTVRALVTAQLSDMEAELNAQLRPAILEVLQGIRLSLPDSSA